MGRDRSNVGQVQRAERRLRNNVLSRLRETLEREERAKLESEFRTITYDLIKAKSADFESKPVVHPSEASGCMLRLAFALRGIPRKASPSADPKMQLTFEIGKAVHEILQDRYGQLKKVSFVPEVGIYAGTSEIAEKYCIEGHCDGIFTVDDIRMGLEIKSISGKGFAALSTPRESYRDQATIYMACLGLQYMMFLFVDKNASLLQPILYEFNPNRWENVSKRIEWVMGKVLSSGHVPKDPERIVCRNMCNFYWYCRPGC